MAVIVLHNSDDQGGRAPALFAGTGAVLINVLFVGSRISPATLHHIRTVTMTYPGPNLVFWMGHGNAGIKVPLRAGHPMTTPPAQCVHSQDLIDALSMLNPERIYFMTCRALRWVEREYQRLYASMSSLPRRVTIFAARVNLLGGALKPTITAILSGVANPPGAFGVGHLFESLDVYGESFIEWQQRSNPQTSPGGYNESPI